MKPHLNLFLVFVLKYQFAYCQKCEIPENDEICFGEAGVWGDPHYTSFDGKKFDFMGKCTYYLVKGLDFFITADHYVLEKGKFVKNFKSLAPSWTKVIEVTYGDDVITLKPSLGVSFNNKPLTKFPHKESNITISKPTGSKLIVELPNYLEVHWDGESTAKIRAPTTMRGYLQGLMGNFNKNPKDDFILPNGTTVNDPNVFGHSWKVDGSCEEENTDPIPLPCDDNPAHKLVAEKACSVLSENLFTGCEGYNSKESYESCVYDCCHAVELGEKCACETIAAYAGQCLNETNPWRKQVPVCEIKCPDGMEYNYCLNPCESSCDYIGVNPSCQKQCLEGCGCPTGKTLDENNRCVEVEKCKCKLNGKYFPSGYKITSDDVIKTCIKGKWVESPNKNPMNNKMNSIKDLNLKCKNTIRNSVYAPCKSSKSLTCNSMDKLTQDETTNDKCEGGCECMEGFVLDTTTNTCVVPKECPCFFNGKSYNNLAERKIINGKCICKTNKWECSKKDHAIEKCSIFGNSIRNFDGKIISFNSDCEFTLARGEFNKKPYVINLKSGEVTLAYADDDNNRVEIEVSKNTVSFNNETDFYSTKLLDLDMIGIQIIHQTNGGYHLKFKSENIDKVEGLCSKLQDPDAIKNKNGLSAFIDSWNNDPTCYNLNIPTKKESYNFYGEPTPNKCDILKSSIFELCTNHIPVDEYFNTCVIAAQNQENPENTHDIYCPIFSTFAQECADVGNPIKWRSPYLCPINCPDKTIYNNCINLCSCEDVEKYGICPENPCSEGCVTTECSTEQVFKNSSYTECVTTQECLKLKCMKELEQKNDENCRCEGEKVVCTPKVKELDKPEGRLITKVPVTTPTTMTPTKPPTKIPKERTRKQQQLFNAFSDVKTTLNRLRDRNISNSLPPKEKELLEMFGGHIIEFEDEINCQYNIVNVENCKCINNEQVCGLPIKNQPGSEHEISNNLELIQFMQQHLKCLEDEFNNPQNCTCVNGKSICPKKEVVVSTTTSYSSTTSKPNPTLYYYTTKCERRIVVSLYNVHFAKKGQNCIKKIKELKDPSHNCVCLSEKLVCYPTPKPQTNIRIPKETSLKVYNEYLNEAKLQLQCQARIANRPETCWCEKGKEVCEKKPQPIPENDNFDVLNQYKESTINKTEIYDQFQKGLKCTEDIGDDSQVCTCLNGEKECFDMDIPMEVPPSDDGNIDIPNPIQEILTKLDKTEPKIVCLMKKNLPNCPKFTHLKPTQSDVTQLNIYNQYIRHINEQLICLRNKPSYCLCVNGRQQCSFKEHNMRGTKEKEKNQLIIYNTFLDHINNQMECLSRLNRQSTGCFCDNGQQKCEQDKNYVIYPLFDDHVLEEYNQDKKFPEIEKQLECFNEIKSISMKCLCTNGVVQCESNEVLPEPNDAFTKLKRNIPDQLNTIKKIDRKMYCFANDGKPRQCRRSFPPQKLTPVISQTDKQLLKVYGNYINHIELQLSCFGNITSSNCMCSNGQLVCGVDIGNMNDRRTNIANTLKTYGLFINNVDSQLNCVESLGDNYPLCNCGIQQMCGTNPRLNKFISLIDPTVYNDPSEMNWDKNSQLQCLSELSNRNDPRCYCLNGLMICDEQSHRRCPEIRCPKNSKLVKRCNDCCPECEREHCVVPTTFGNNTQEVVLKQIGESWMENVCKECYCKKDNLGTYIQCIRYVCPLPESKDIAYNYIKVEGKCCPQLVQIGCKQDEKLYPLGSIISKTLCETLSCVRNRNGDVVKQIDKTICSSCPTGFAYIPSNTHCCGECIAMGCVYNNEIKHQGDVWFTDDKCYKMKCTQSNGNWVLSKHRKICRPVGYCNGVIQIRDCCNYCIPSV